MLYEAERTDERIQEAVTVDQNFRGRVKAGIQKIRVCLGSNERMR